MMTSDQKICKVLGSRSHIEDMVYNNHANKNAVNCAFCWDLSPQQADYWYYLNEKFMKGEALPEEALSYARWLLRDDTVDNGEG